MADITITGAVDGASGAATTKTPSPAVIRSDAVEQPTVAIGKTDDEKFSIITEALEAANDRPKGSLRLQIDRDDGAGRFVYKAVDSTSGDIVQQFPAEEMLELLSYYRALGSGLLVNDKA